MLPIEGAPIKAYSLSQALRLINAFLNSIDGLLSVIMLRIADEKGLVLGKRRDKREEQ